MGDKVEALAVLALGKESILSIEPDAGRVSEPVWTLGTSIKYDACPESRTTTKVKKGMTECLHCINRHAC